MQKKRVIFSLMVFALSCVFITGCGNPKFDSKWRDCQINIDGKFDEWRDAFAYYDEKTRVNIGIINDDTYLYICLISRNRSLMEQLMRSGLTVWFDSKGGNKKTFGIHFPAGMQDRGMPMGGRGEGAMRPDKKDLGEPPEIFQEPWQEIEIIGPGKEERYTTTIEAAEKDGISVKIGESKGYFVYELKVPLVENEQHSYAIGVNMNKPIGIGFETSGFNAEMMRGMGKPGGGGRGGMEMPGGGMPGGGGGMPGGGMPGGGMPGGGGGMPGGGMPGGGMPDDRGEMPRGEKGFQLWLTVMLSSRHSAIP